MESQVTAVVESPVIREPKASKRPKIVTYHIIGGTIGFPKAFVTIDIEGKHYTDEAVSKSGPLDATALAIKKVIAHDAVLVYFKARSVGRGTETQARVVIVLEDSKGRKMRAESIHSDTNLAFARAYLDAVTQLKLAVN